MNNKFAERLKTTLEQKNMKQIDLVKRASEQGVKLGKSHVSQYLSGKTMPRSEILHFLADALEVDAEWLKGNDAVTENATSARNVQKRDVPLDRNLKGRGKDMKEESKVREFKKSSKLNNVLYDVRGRTYGRGRNSGTEIEHWKSCTIWISYTG